MGTGTKNPALRRLDKLLVERGLAPSREVARDMIQSGAVEVSGFPQSKPASMFPADASVSVSAGGERWVSRGAYKLIKGLDEFGVDPAGLSCVDIGASTGGFTQVLLSRGALRVAAVDVGYGQLAWVLRNDPRVLLLERTNARYIKTADIGWQADILTVDASFISLRLLLPSMKGLLSEKGRIIALVKPQFEVGRERVGKGVVRGAAIHVEVLRGVADFASEAGLSVVGASYSPIRGPEGNIEFIFLLGEPGEAPSSPIDFESLVSEAHEKL
ncbi:MAG: TlyA family RNA methyltransferase [Synergistaceae bacterium]|jgi:23S rRNA (cytidine1920-2'-O)/16S rRNA (cytidine1409-2'-O)-methyltransferase|nr:TlyA family RNA methyltransferase [Synergistaceae bacterium]